MSEEDELMVEIVSEHLFYLYRTRVEDAKKTLLGVCMINSRNETRVSPTRLMEEMGIEETSKGQVYLILNELRKLKILVNLRYRGWYITPFGRKVLSKLMKKIMMYELKKPITV